MNLNPDLLSEILKISLSGDGDFAEVFCEQCIVNRFVLEDSKIERAISGLETGAGLRIFIGEQTVYAYTNDLSPEGMKEAALSIRQAGKKTGRGDVNLGKKRFNKPEIPEPPSEFPTEKKAGILKEVDRSARTVDRRIVQVTGICSDRVQDVLIANSDGLFVQDRRINIAFYVNVIAADAGVIQTGRETIGNMAGYEIFKSNSPVSAAETAARRAIRVLEAKRVKGGTMPVVLAGEAGGTMIHEAVGHGLEADLVQKKLSKYAGCIGQQIASQAVTVIDDATLPGNNGSFGFDDEGTAAKRKVLVENGILRGFMYDILTARTENRDSTGNGRRQSYMFRPIPRMTNTYIAPGKSRPEQIIRSVSNGLLVKRMGGGQVNTVNGDFVFEVNDGMLIEKGEVKETVRGATLTGNGMDVLKKISAVADDLRFIPGTCGKDGQGVPVSDAQPTLLIDAIIVG